MSSMYGFICIINMPHMFIIIIYCLSQLEHTSLDGERGGVVEGKYIGQSTKYVAFDFRHALGAVRFVTAHTFLTQIGDHTELSVY